jgi:hypothetical protein
MKWQMSSFGLLKRDSYRKRLEVEVEDEYGLRRRGHSKDKRPDLSQAVIGPAVTRTGIPVRCWVWPGNKADMSVIKQVKGDLVGWRLGRVITVVDRGFAGNADKDLRSGASALASWTRSGESSLALPRACTPHCRHRISGATGQ